MRGRAPNRDISSSPPPPGASAVSNASNRKIINQRIDRHAERTVQRVYPSCRYGRVFRLLWELALKSPHVMEFMQYA